MGTKFTIITPTYNVGDKILTTLNSILEQNYIEYEYIIMDGMSSDNIKERLAQYIESESRIRFFEGKDYGIYDAMNKAIDKATGEYCYFIGAGDVLYDSDVLGKIADSIEEDGDDIIYGYVKAVGGKGTTDIKYMLDYRYIVQFFPVCHQAVFAKTKLLKERMFDLTYEVGADQDWLMHMKKMRKTFKYVNIPVAKYMLDGFSNSEHGKARFDKEKVRIHKKYYPVFYFLITNYRKIRKVFWGRRM